MRKIDSAIFFLIAAGMVFPKQLGMAWAVIQGWTLFLVFWLAYRVVSLEREVRELHRAEGGCSQSSVEPSTCPPSRQ